MQLKSLYIGVINIERIELSRIRKTERKDKIMENNLTLNPKKTYTVKEVAAILGVSKNTVYSLVNSNPEFKVVRFGKTIRISKPSFDEWMRDIL